MRLLKSKAFIMALWLAAAIAVVSRVNGCSSDHPTPPDCPADSVCHEQGKGVGGQ